MAEPSFEIAVAHRWFAIECNNEAWQILEQPQINAMDRARVMHIAHASTYHWIQCGTPLNELRAMHLLIYACIRLGEDGEAYADRVEQLLNEVADQLTDWDRVCSWAWIGVIRGSTPMRNDAKKLAMKLEVEDRAVFEKLNAMVD